LIQPELIFEKGKHLATRPYYNYFINLNFQEDEFYEVWCFPDEIRIGKIEKLTDEKKLNLYIDFELKTNPTQK
jgi:hypothetical protein